MNETSTSILRWAERVKSLCMMLIGSLLVWFAVENYVKLTNSKIGMAYVRIPRILEWAYENIGLVPSVLLQIVMGVSLAVYGAFRLIRVGRVG